MSYNIMKVYADGSKARSQTHDTLAQAQAGLVELAAGYDLVVEQHEDFVVVQRDDIQFKFEIVVAI